jgi:UDP-N-acetyl-2-amino-2-deoxyglucuronate dehydrogenase
LTPEFKMRFAIIGCGHIAERHAKYMSIHGILDSVCDIEKKKADDFSLKFNAKAFYDIDDFLAEKRTVDVVAVCTPNGLHAEQTIKILNAGMHVLCEKPMAIRTCDCEDMIRAVENSGKHLIIVKQNRFNPPVQELKKMLDEGILGKIYSLQLNCFWNRNEDYYSDSWKGTLALDGGTLFTQFSHFIDLLYWLVGDVKEATALFKNYAHKGIIEFEDTGVVLLEFINGVIGSINYTVNSHANNMEGSVTLFGEKGTVKIGGQYLNLIEYQDIEDYTIQNLPQGKEANNYGSYIGSMSNHDKVYENLVSFLNNQEPSYMNALEGMKTVEIIEKIYKSGSRNFDGEKENKKKAIQNKS